MRNVTMTMTLARAIWRLDEAVVVTGGDYTILTISINGIFTFGKRVDGHQTPKAPIVAVYRCPGKNKEEKKRRFRPLLFDYIYTPDQSS
jgi:hypothetical protein